ncbi:MAG: AI-2E family transporter [Methylocystis sp.]|nr:AI-2E family transporter [Methylocystis sp.]MCA3584485.1 AI-2E family transporter [Methylocystis sp.]MCA3588026.1 AI-2E family transporter [Methylocystis sp.]MCA3590493.1 AI-2E family transporter [Methylocystis sp.]
MTLQRKIGFWLSAFAIFAAVVWILRDVLMPFAAGMVLAYLLDPLADRLEKWGLGRMGASLLILIAFVLLFVMLLVVAVPLLGTQVMAFIEKAPGYVTRLQILLVEQGGPLLQKVGGEKALDDLQTSLGDFVGKAMSWLGTFLTSIWSGGQALLGILSLLVVTPVVAFYILLDWDRMVARVDSWVPVDQRETVRQIMGDIDTAISSFLRGQTLVCLILGGMYAVGLMLVGLNFGLLIGISAGLLSFIPYVGSMLGLVVSVGVAIAQFWPDWTMVGLVLLVFGIGQFIEGYILSPKLVGESVGLHPVWLMFALIAAGSLFGFLGLLIAVPVSAAIGVLVRFAIKQYLASPLYSGRSGLATESGDASAASDG